MVERMVEAHGVGGSSPSFPTCNINIKGDNKNMTKIQFLQWVLDLCICSTPVYFLFDIVAVYGYARLHYLGKRVYKPYLIVSVILTTIMTANCMAIWALSKIV